MYRLFIVVRGTKRVFLSPLVYPKDDADHRVLRWNTWRVACIASSVRVYPKEAMWDEELGEERNYIIIERIQAAERAWERLGVDEVSNQRDLLLPERRGSLDRVPDDIHPIEWVQFKL